MIPLHRYEIVEKTFKHQWDYIPQHFLHLQFCGGRPHSFGNGVTAVLEVSKDVWDSVKPGDKMHIQYEVTL